MRMIRWIKCLWMCLFLLGMVSCKKDNQSGNGTIKTYLYVDVASRADGVVADPADKIYQLKVCAYNADGQLVGYKEVTQNADQAIQMDLTESGDITFLVVANEEYGTQVTVSLEKSDFWGTQLTGFYKDGDVYAPPMSNPERKTDGAENRVFAIAEDECTTVNIELERAVSRICFYFAKTESDEELRIKSISLNRGVGCGYLFPPEDASDYRQYTDEQIRTIFQSRPSEGVEILGSTTEITAVVNTDISVDNSEKSVEYYVFPCPYGSTNPDVFTWPGDNTYNRSYSYYVTMNYVVDDHSFQKYIYLPTVGQNQNINILCKIPPKGVSVQPTFTVETKEWATVTNNVVFE